MLIDRMRQYVPETAMIPPSAGSLEGQVFRAQGGRALWFFRIAIRCTADAILQMQERRNEMAARADIERLFANDYHLLRDIGLFEHGCETTEMISAAPCEQTWAYDRMRERT
jgi:hypothetical protein